MYDPLVIRSHKGDYPVFFETGKLSLPFTQEELYETHFIIDRKIAELYQDDLHLVLRDSSVSVMLIDANEKSKSLEEFPEYVAHLVKNKLRRNHKLIAIGGGITQDITCFLAATMLRGLEWWYIPTTLLAQADSCIGSKSSINCSDVKNILGTFTPPNKIIIYPCLLRTLDFIDVQSGFGEMLKVHAIKGPDAFNEISENADLIFSDQDVMLKYIIKSLEIKKDIIERDEFDLNVRRVMNYGHTFGHAIETATNYEIPHGIAVTIGMDMANYVSAEIGFGNTNYFIKNHAVLKRNFSDFVTQEIPFELFISAIAKDKKNVGKSKLGLILPNNEGVPTPIYHENNACFEKACINYFSEARFL